MQHFKTTLLFLLLCCCAALAGAAPAPSRPSKLVFAMTESTYASPQGAWIHAIYREVFSSMDIAIEIVPLPTNRASALLKSGAVDGDIHRSLAYGVMHADLVRVEQAHFSVRFAAYSKLPQLPVIASWNDFAGSPLRIEYILGSITPQQQLSQRIPAEHLSTVKSVEQGLRKLVVDHSDILVALDLSTDQLLDAPLFQRSGIVKVGTLEQVDGYLYLQKKYAWLAPEISRSLARMKRSGRIDKLGEQARQNWKVQ